MRFDTPIPPLRYVEAVPVEQDEETYLVLRDPQGFSDSMIAVAAGALPVLQLFDGRRSVRDVAAILQHETQQTVEPEQIYKIVETLDNARLLNSEEFLRHRLVIEEKFRAEPVREPVLAGGGYPDDVNELKQLLDHYLASPPPDDFAPEKPLKGKRLRGLMLPHIDYTRGGASYGRLYSQLTELLPDPDEGPLLIGIIGVTHSGAFEPAITTAKDFSTPLGLMKYDRSAVELLKEKLGDGAVREEFIHKAEHSIEIQIPWLQHVLNGREVTFLPILAGILETDGKFPSGSRRTQAALDALRDVEKAHNGPVIWIASVDFAHMGPAFGDENQVNDTVRAAVERKDMKALEAVQKTDADEWWRQLQDDDNERRVCGVNATYLTLSLLQGCKGRILDYQQSVTDDRSTMVTYVSAIFQEA